MSRLANPAEMLHNGAPRLIRSDEELEEYTKALLSLDSKEEKTGDEYEAIELLTLLIERYENEHYPIPEAKPVEVLRYLMARNGVSQQDLVPEFNSESTV